MQSIPLNRNPADLIVNDTINNYFGPIKTRLISVAIRFKLNSNLYLKDPQDTKLGRRIIQHSILLIDQLGFEKFTFRKLARACGSTEASVYRYFENKHLLLIYLVSWYWEWVAYQIDLTTANINNPTEKLRRIIHDLVDASTENPAIEFVNEKVLHRIVIAEGAKAYHTKDVDEENKKGLFSGYKILVDKICGAILEMNPDFLYPHALASNLVEMANNHIYFAEHLPHLTDIKVHGEDFSEVTEMIEFFVFTLLDRSH